MSGRRETRFVFNPAVSDRMRPLDKPDRLLLSAVQRSVKLTAAQLGELCGLSPTAALKRLKKLRDDRLIEAEIAIVPPKALGYDVTALALVTLDREGSAIIDSFKRTIRETPEIIQAFLITGEADFFLTIVARNLDEYEAFTREYFYERHEVRNFKTLIVLDRVKGYGPLPIPE